MTKSAGEHWVCSVLARYGWAPALTRDGLERTDILAVQASGSTRTPIEIQVKALNDVGPPAGQRNVGWGGPASRSMSSSPTRTAGIC